MAIPPTSDESHPIQEVEHFYCTSHFFKDRFELFQILILLLPLSEVRLLQWPVEISSIRQPKTTLVAGVKTLEESLPLQEMKKILLDIALFGDRLELFQLY